MALVIAPTPCDQHIHIQEKFHQGKSARTSRTDSEVGGGVPDAGAKTMLTHGIKSPEIR